VSDTAALSLLIVGDPAFGTGAAASGEFVPLPGTAVEARAIAQIARRSGARVTQLSGEAATDLAVLDALPAQRLVHIATHGFFGGSEGSAAGTRGVVAAAPAPRVNGARREGPPRNPLLESGLAFAGANLAASSGAGRLTAEELLGGDLHRAQLVVLSACETGLGAQVAGQGVLGLQSAILAAGARGVVMSLWKVPDESTALLMTEFYRGMLALKLSPAAALARAQGVVRADPRFRAPVHWAAWVLTGDVF
jgi:CHAT domain-containing protein